MNVLLKLAVKILAKKFICNLKYATLGNKFDLLNRSPTTWQVKYITCNKISFFKVFFKEPEDKIKKHSFLKSFYKQILLCINDSQANNNNDEDRHQRT